MRTVTPAERAMIADALDILSPDSEEADAMRLRLLAEFQPGETDPPECGQCEGTGRTDAMGHDEECPVCDGTGQLRSDPQPCPVHRMPPERCGCP